jgi:ankyrin repeat protein
MTGMKKNIKYVFLSILLASCSGTKLSPEELANKLFVEASNLINDAEKTDVNLFESAYTNRINAINILDSIPSKYPETQIAVKISQGNYSVSGIFITEIKKSVEAESPFHEAAYEGKIKDIIVHLATGTDVDLKYKDSDETALSLAILQGNKKVCDLLVMRQADVDHAPENERGGTCLTRACENGNISIVELLIDNGADLTKSGKSFTDTTPLKAAIKSGNLEIINLLINKGVDANYKEEGFMIFSPLEEAILSKRLDTVKILVQNGANVNMRGLYYPISRAISSDSIELVNYLISEKVDINQRFDPFGINTPLHLAIEVNADLEIIKALVNNGANINALSNDGTPYDVINDWQGYSLIRKLQQRVPEYKEWEIETRMIKGLLKSGGAKTSAELKASQN